MHNIAQHLVWQVHLVLFWCPTDIARQVPGAKHMRLI